ncbi:MAG: hypothetical protein Kow0013_21760 [Pararhodobacter sp.]
MQGAVHLQTRGPGLHEVTDAVAGWLPGGDGLLSMMMRDTSCSLLIQENAAPDARTGLIAWLFRLVTALLG